MEIGRKIKILYVAVVVLVAAVVVSNLYPIFTAPSLEDKRAELIKILSDGQYDQTYSLLELKGSRIEEFMKYFRPVWVAIIYEDTLVYQAMGTGMLIDNYVFTSPALFQPLFYPDVREALANGTLNMLIRVFPDLGQNDPWDYEPIEKPIRYLGNVVVLERETPTVFPSPKEYPFRLGRIEDLNAQSVLLGIGSTFGGEGMVLYPYRGTTEFVYYDQGFVLFSASLTGLDFGGPIFAIRDGEFELIGIVQAGGDGKAVAVDMNTVFNELEIAGIRLELEFGK